MRFRLSLPIFISGVSTLKGQGTSALTLDGTVALKNGATLTESGITGGVIAGEGAVTVNNSTISSGTLTVGDDAVNSVTGALAFTGISRLNGVTLTATDRHPGLCGAPEPAPHPLRRRRPDG